jgi:hypothetical protein
MNPPEIGTAVLRYQGTYGQIGKAGLSVMPAPCDPVPMRRLKGIDPSSLPDLVW